ncbi:peroxiredoxin-like family protein [Acidocella sp.]|uniref:peroxiredoxin-like family protein n=1 Tax=Acidocella sp. TaxID=50710 RepID=UPI00262B01F9|nr:peroxiredoxin-like family protein [Acidocella sp.]
MTDRLGALLAARRENPDWDAAYIQVLGTLARTGFLEGILPQGAVFPEFCLPSAAGRLVTLRDELARGPVVLVFFRGEWCPFCKLMAEALAEAAPRISQAGGRLLTLTPETGDLPARFSARHHGAFEVLCDVDFGVGVQAGVVYRVPPLYRARLGAVDLAMRHGNAAWCLPVPAVFIIRPDGVVSWRFAEGDFAKRPEPDEIIARLEGQGAWS